MAAAQFITQADAENRVAQKEWNTRVEQGLADCYKNFPELVPSQQTAETIIDWCDRYMGVASIPNAIILRAAKEQNRQAFKEDFGPLSLAVQKQRQEIIARILILLANGGAMTEHDLNVERRRLNMGFTRDQLLNREQMIINAQRLAAICKAKGVEGVKAERAEMRGDNEPRLMVLLPSEWTPKALKELARTNLPAFKKLCRDFGDKQVTDRLQGRS